MGFLVALMQGGDDGGGALGAIVGLLFAVVVIGALWKIFTKAGQPGWAAIIPIYNLIVLMRIVGRPGWWVVLMLIPIVNIIILILVYIDLAKSFGHGIGFALGLIFLNVIFLLILGYGGSRYVGPAAAMA
jgi:hypothetical protein